MADISKTVHERLDALEELLEKFLGEDDPEPKPEEATPVVNQPTPVTTTDESVKL